METKYTHGPWKRHPTPVTGKPGSLIGPWDDDKYYTDRRFRRYVASVNAAETAEETIANCNLISAAPDLYETCKEMLEVLTEPGIMDVDEWKAWKRKTEAKARAAIEKAEGGQE